VKAHRFRFVDETTPAAKARKQRHNTREYREAGKRATAQVKAGLASCWRCRRRIPSTAVRGPDWQLGHDDWQVNLIRGPECTRCNRTAAGRKGNLVQRRNNGGQPNRRGQRRKVRRVIKPLEL